MGSLGFDPTTLPILAVALITWGGVFVYLVRLDLLSRRVEDEVRAHEAERAHAEHLLGGEVSTGYVDLSSHDDVAGRA